MTKRIEYGKEVWRDVPGYEGQYKVSNYGRVMSLGRYTDTWYGGREVNQKIIAAYSKNGGTLQVTIGPRDNELRTSVARIVLLAFRGPPPGEHYIAYQRDGNYDNLHLSNLEWMSRSEFGKRRAAEKRLSQLLGV